MNRRKTAIQIIIADVAENGIAGKASIRAYVETRMSLQTFSEAKMIGRKIYEQKNNKSKFQQQNK